MVILFLLHTVYLHILAQYPMILAKTIFFKEVKIENGTFAIHLLQ